MRLGMATDVGQVREKNEDSMGWQGNLFVVADGMGGHNAGEIASSLVVEHMLSIDDEGAAFSEKLQETLLTANDALLDYALHNAGCEGMGTTVAVLHLEGAKATVGHVGDSRVYHWRNGELVRLTRDHSLVEELVQNGGITIEQARTHPQRHILTRALGGPEIPEVEVIQVPINPGERFLLCTDGLTGPITDQELTEAMMKSEDPQALADQLVSLANEKGGPDNITVMVIEV
ncbi:MAG TPA: Stp1/IreP family PP2C-type Ser/Thr phosphatase [Bacillota bacterium]|nr:Stp1/IreP family PP2C-type Ser/Thr phosphatase [Bacillota bacterium]